MLSLRRMLLPLPLAAAAAASLGCGSKLVSPTYSNAVDTVTLGALVGTPVTTPSAFSVIGDGIHAFGVPVRSDQTSAFDFAFNIDANGQPVFLPLALLGLTPKTTAAPGLRASTLAFDDILTAPSDGYVTQDTVPIAVGDRFLLRSRVTCSILGGVPEYGKLEVLDIDTTERTVTFQVLTNNNCGYKDLTTGIPAN